MTVTADFDFRKKPFEFAHSEMVRFIKSEVGKETSPETDYKYARGLEDFSKWLNEQEESVEEADFVTLQNWLSYLSNKKGYADKTIYTKFVPVRLFYEHLEKLEIIDNNPASSVDVTDYIESPHHTAKEEATGQKRVFLDKDEIEELVDSVPSPRFRNRLAILFLYYTGLRVGEATEVKVDDLNRAERTVEVTVKGGDTHTATWHEKLDGLLTQWLDYGYRDSYPTAEDSEYIFVTNTTEQLSANRLNKIIDEAADNAGLQETLFKDAEGREIKKVSAHTLRHSFAMNFLQDGGTFEALSNRLAHSSVTTTEIYGEVADDRGIQEYQEVMEPIGVEDEIEYDQCPLCDQKGNLQTHHISYQPPQVISVCATCHQNITQKDKYRHLRPDKSREWAEEQGLL